MKKNGPIVLAILDGFGHSDLTHHNAIKAARTPHLDEWFASYPHMLLDASGAAVGLPDAQMGNSEVGHMHIGAGRIIYQDYTRINQAIAQHTFAEHPVLLNRLHALKAANKTLHVLGLCSWGGVHAHEDHLLAFLSICHRLDYNKVALHLFLDGRDTPPRSALQSIEKIEAFLSKYPTAHIASISGRYYAMDRDKRWERTARAYNLFTSAYAEHRFDNAKAAIEYYYHEGVDDEFIPPTQIGRGKPIEEGDGIFFFNFRQDRTRQLTDAFLNDALHQNPEARSILLAHHLTVAHAPRLSCFITMTQYGANLKTDVLYPPQSLDNTFGEVVASHGLRQLRIAETEKYAHVTFFFNGGREIPFANEDRLLIPSPKVATYNLKPEMSAKEVTDKLIEGLINASYDVVICNYANADMVGHTGDFKATVQAIECLDECLGRIWGTLKEMNGILLITSDHGNAEMMYDEQTKQPQTAHTSNLVPFLMLSHQWRFKHAYGSLIDIAPSLLVLLGIMPPKEMTGQVLVNRQ